MPFQLYGTIGTVAEVDASWRALRSSNRPLEHGGRGHYRLGVASGLLTGTGVTAGGTVFSARWSDSSRLFVLLKLSARYVVTTTFGAAIIQELGLDAIVARSWTASDSAQTAVVIAGNDQKSRTSLATSLFAAGDVRIGNTSIITAGTRTLDSNPFVGMSGISSDLNATAATSQLVAGPNIGFEWMADASLGEHPIVLAQSEGIVVRNTVTFLATGAMRLWIQMVWAEVVAY